MCVCLCMGEFMACSRAEGADDEPCAMMESCLAFVCFLLSPQQHEAAQCVIKTERKYTSPATFPPHGSLPLVPVHALSLQHPQT